MMHHYRNTPRVLLALLTGCLLLLLPEQGEAQKVAGKINLLYGATTAPNAAAEFRLGKQLTLEIGGGGSLWAFDEDTRYKHWLLQPELRWWACDVFNGHFLGLHLHTGQYNIGGINIPVGRLKAFNNHRFQGYFYGAGLSYGYQWILSKHWNVEASIGGGYARIQYEKFPCATCGTKEAEGAYNYWGVTRATMSLIYLF